MRILDLVFPKSCVSCNKKGSYFCSSCLNTIKPSFQICPVCGKQSPFGQTHRYCVSEYAFDGLFSLFNYGVIIRKAIHQLKYKYVTNLEEEFWQLIKNEVEKKEASTSFFNQFVVKEKPVVVPIPLHWYKQRKRGFNQSSLFAKRFSNHFNLQYSDKILVRKKYVESQTKLTKKEREENVKGIFLIKSVSLRAMQEHGEAISVLLVDDVWTTGSTMKEAARVLKEAGVKKVWGLTVAR